jgi:hypothetical protein
LAPAVVLVQELARDFAGCVGSPEQGRELFRNLVLGFLRHGLTMSLPAREDRSPRPEESIFPFYVLG